MTGRTLIVARIAPDAAEHVARLFARSDRTELPVELGVRSRQLYLYHDLYFHHVEFDGDPAEAMRAARQREDFVRLCEDLEPHVRPFDPQTWRSPADAMATPFYSWTRKGVLAHDLDAG